MNGDDVNGWGAWRDLFARADESVEGTDDGVDALDVRAALASCRDER